MLIYRITGKLNILLLLYLLQDGLDMVDEDEDVDADKNNKGADAAQQPSAGKRKNGNSWKTSRQTLLPLQQPPAVNSPGPTIILTGNAEPYEFFRLFFDDTLLEMIKGGTNEYT